jgi:hypothetical protein
MIFRGRRKRNKAARLHPLGEDADSTTQLFNGVSTYGNGAATPHDSPAPTEAESDDLAAPRLRYEWRSANGEVLVVEAGVPEPHASVPGLRHIRFPDATRLDLRR